MTEPAVDPRRERWERAFEWPLTILAALFLGAYAWPILDPGLSDAWLKACRLTTLVVWLAFVADYVVRLALSHDRVRFVRRHLLDLAVIGLPLLRPLRMLALVRAFTVLNRKAGHSLRGRVMVYVAGTTALLLFVAALAMLDAERASGGNIDEFADALWWAFATVTTVGYGDHYPVTGTGRLVAVSLMFGGIALLGVVTATLASWLVDRVAEEEEADQAATRRDVERLAAEVAALGALLQQGDERPRQDSNLRPTD